MQWSEELNTGIAEIDSQNRRIADFINTLEEARSSADRDKIAVVLNELLDFVVNHFLFEEHLMAAANYEGLPMHEKIHEIFAKRLADLRGRFARGEVICDDLLVMLNNWVQNHVRDEDMRYAASVRRKIEAEGGQSWVSGLFKKLFG